MKGRIKITLLLGLLGLGGGMLGAFIWESRSVYRIEADKASTSIIFPPPTLPPLVTPPQFVPGINPPNFQPPQ